MTFLPRHPAVLPSLAFFAAAIAATPTRADDWLVLSGFSYHFQQDREHFRQNNPGIGYEHDLEGTPEWLPATVQGWIPDWREVTFSAGYFTNSYDRQTFYVGGRWEPLHWGPLRAGAFGLLGSGYDSPVLILPSISADFGPVGANLVLAPNLPGYSGYLGLQFRISSKLLM